jgi:hypothetical protein
MNQPKLTRVAFVDVNSTLQRCLEMLFPERVLKEDRIGFADSKLIYTELLVRITRLQDFFKVHSERQVRSILCTYNMDGIKVYIDGDIDSDDGLLGLRTKVYFDEVCMGDFVLTKIIDKHNDENLISINNSETAHLTFQRLVAKITPLSQRDNQQDTVTKEEDQPQQNDTTTQEADVIDVKTAFRIAAGSLMSFIANENQRWLCAESLRLEETLRHDNGDWLITVSIDFRPPRQETERLYKQFRIGNRTGEVFECKDRVF